MANNKIAPIIYEYRCKLCQMSRTHPDLFRDVHSQILESGLSMNRAMNYINARIDSEQIDCAKLNNQNMKAHFNAHVAIPDRVNQELARVPGAPAAPTLSSVNPAIGHEIEDMVRRKVGNEVNDYLN